jgi:hypothetical protein
MLLASLLLTALVVTEQQQAKAGRTEQQHDNLKKQACILLKKAIDHSNLELKNVIANGTGISQSYLDKRTHAIELYNNDCK